MAVNEVPSPDRDKPRIGVAYSIVHRAAYTARVSTIARRLTQSLVLLAALWGVLLTLGLRSGKLPAEVARELGSVPPPVPLAKDTRPCPSSPTAAMPPAPTPTAAPEPSAQPPELQADRYRVCGREETAPALSSVRLLKEQPALWALHCGPSVHLLAITRAGERLEPTRIVELHAPSYSPAEAPRAQPVAAADIDGDGRVDLVVPLLFLDRAGAPSGGALYLLRQRAEGGFEPATRVLDLAPGAVVPAVLDAEPGTDLALLQLHDTHTARQNELWLVHGGPAPLRFAAREVGLGTSTLAAVDLDGDGVDDVAVASESEGRVRLWLSRRGAVRKTDPVLLELPKVRELLVGDLDGDGQRDLVLTGEKVWFLSARKDFVPEPMAVAGSEGLRDVQLEDTNADGRPDLVGYAHPAMIALEQRDDRGFERRTLATLHGELGVLFARIARLDQVGQLDLLVVTVSREPDVQVELAVARNLISGSGITLSPNVQTLRDAPLSQHFYLP